jgi:hypothetical protein
MATQKTNPDSHLGNRNSRTQLSSNRSMDVDSTGAFLKTGNTMNHREQLAFEMKKRFDIM